MIELKDELERSVWSQAFATCVVVGVHRKFESLRQTFASNRWKQQSTSDTVADATMLLSKEEEEKNAEFVADFAVYSLRKIRVK